MSLYLLPTHLGSMEDIALGFVRDAYVQGKIDMPNFESDVEAILNGDIMRFVEGGLGPLPRRPDPGLYQTL